MYIEELSHLTDFIASSKRSLDEICRHLYLHTFQRYAPIGIYLGQINSNGYVALKSFFGFDHVFVSQWELIPLTAEFPITHAIRRTKSLIIPTQQEFLQNFPEVEKFGVVQNNWNSCIAAPVQSLGVYFVAFQGKPDLNDEFAHFLETIGHLLALHLPSSGQDVSAVKNSSGSAEKLSPRQQIIKDLISKGHTNAHIAMEIGFSESLIRQETIAIYAALHISGRHELIKLVESELKSKA